MHWTLSDPSPAPRAVVRAVAEAARVSAALAEELVDMGAVYVDDWPEGRPEARGESSESDESSAASSSARLFGWSYVEGVSPPPTQALSKAKKKARWTRACGTARTWCSRTSACACTRTRGGTATGAGSAPPPGARASFTRTRTCSS